MSALPHKQSTEAVIKAYQDGLEGWIWNIQVEREWEKFWSGRPSLYTTNQNLKDLHKKHPRIMLWKYREKFDPKAFDEEAQTTGDCVSHGSRNARDITRSVEVARGDSAIYYKRGATEPTYGARGHGGQGMDPTRATEFEMEHGFLFREPYRFPDLGVSVDLSKYNSNIGSNWGRSGVPDGIKELCKQYQVGDNARPTDVEAVMDLLANGNAGHSGQSWGCSSSQPKDGINRKSAGWNHDMATSGYDYSEEYFKEPVIFVNNSWGKWNQPNPVWMANQDVYGPWISGMIVIAVEEYERYFVKSGSIHFYSEIKGFPNKELPWIESGVI
jgi:hypothetical protein